MKKKDQYIAETINKAFEEISKAIGMMIKITKPLGQADQSLISFCPISFQNSKLQLRGTSRIFSGTKKKYVPFLSIHSWCVTLPVFVPSSVSEKEVGAVIDSVTGPLANTPRFVRRVHQKV